MNKNMVYWLFTGMAVLSSCVEMNAQTETQENQPELNGNETIMYDISYLEIKGMHCQAGCANGIDAMLKEQQGIIKSKTSFDKSSAVIEYDFNLIAQERIMSLITERGFTVKKVSAEKEDTPQH